MTYNLLHSLQLVREVIIDFVCMHVQQKHINHLYEDPLSNISLFELILFFLTISKESNKAKKASDIIKKYSNITALLHADSEVLKLKYTLSDRSILLFRLVREMVLRRKKEEISNTAMPSNYDAFIEYCQIVLGENSKEIIAIFYLDGEWRVIEEEFISQGHSGRVYCDTIDITRKAITYRAKGVVIAHNHPSGKLITSSDDLLLTRDLKTKLETFQIVLLDSLIFANSTYISILKEERFFNSIEAKNLKFLLNQKQQDAYFDTIKAIPKLGIENLKKTKSIIKNHLEELANIYEESGLVVSKDLIQEFWENRESHKIRSKNPKYLGKQYIKILNTRASTYFSYLDTQERFKILSKKYFLIFKEPLSNIIGKRLEEVIGSNGYQICSPFLKKAMNGMRCSFRYPWENHCGVVKYLTLHYIPHLDCEKKVKGVAVFLEPVSSDEQLRNWSEHSAISSILPKHFSNTPTEIDETFFSEVMSHVKLMFKQHNVILDISVLTDITNNLYTQFYDSKKIELGYITAIISNGLKTGKLSKHL